jgi:hypothetical protein
MSDSDKPIKSPYMPRDPNLRRTIGDRNRALGEAKRAESRIEYIESHPDSDMSLPAAAQHATSMRAEVARLDRELAARHYDPNSRKNTDADPDIYD